MKVAYLIIAHSVNAQLRHLVRHLLRDPRSHVIVHLDRRCRDKSWLDDFKHPRLQWISRFRVNWGAYSLVEAILATLDRAFDDPETERFVLLSGTCVPLKKPGILEDTILKSPSSFAIWGKLDKNSAFDRYGMKAISKFFPYDNNFLNPKSGFMQRMLWSVIKPVNMVLPYRRKLPSEPIWKGSMFFIADRPLASAILRDSKRLEPFLRFSHGSDEILAQTVYARRLTRTGSRVPITDNFASLQGSHYIRRRVPKRTLLQRVLGQPHDDRAVMPEDVSDAFASGALFIRKCSPEIAEEIFEIMERPG